MPGRPFISLEPIGYVTTAYAEPSGLPPQASANPEASGAVVVRNDLADALLGLDRSNTILTHR
jgi:tRNA (Thr-GGU) A37 N-methylase